tara:strand:- start:858 stop:1019 length:162 start_codon:yes stop_codon:yes gene_type:complete
MGKKERNKSGGFKRSPLVLPANKLEEEMFNEMKALKNRFKIIKKLLEVTTNEK